MYKDNRAKRPRATRKFRGPMDIKKVPKDPPFRAFIGNLSYDATDEDIQDFFGESVVSVRLMKDDGRPRRYRFVDFETRHALIDALAMDDEMLLDRKLRIDLTREQHSQGERPIPRICKFYNVEAGCWNDAKSRQCPYLHLCKYYLVDACKFGTRCKRSHNLTNQRSLSILEKYGIETKRTPKEILADLKEMFQNDDCSDSESIESAPESGSSRTKLASANRLRHLSEDDVNFQGSLHGPGTRSDTDSSHTVPMNNRARQQTALKKFRDIGKIKTIPKDPPFRAYLGNLSYAATKEDIQHFFGKSVLKVRLMEDDGRLRGYGFVEFWTRHALIDALVRNDEMFLNRKLGIYVAGKSQQGEEQDEEAP